MIINDPMNNILSELLVMHEKGETPEKAYIEAHLDLFERLFERGLGCIRISRFAAGGFRHRNMYSGVLTRSGIAAAKALRR